MDNQEQYRDSSLPVSENNRPNRLPPIRILDLIVLTFAMAFVFMVQDKIMAYAPELFLFQPTAWLIIRMFNAVPTGIAVASIFWIVNQKRITGRFFLHPGHWVLASYALITTFTFSLWFLLLRYLDIKSAGSWTQVCILLGLAYLAASALMIFAFFSNPARWRGVIATLAISYAISGIVLSSGLSVGVCFVVRSTDLGFGEFFANTICILALIVAVMIDIRNRTSRDWLHWVGLLVLFLAFAVQPIVGMMVTRFFLNPQSL